MTRKGTGPASSAGSIAATIRSWLGDVRHFPERLKHDGRRARARAELQGVHIDSALFICHGNICRSPFAAALFDRSMRGRTRTRIVVASAGFIGPGRQSPQFALSTASRRGIDLSSHRSALITQGSVDATDLIVVMDPAQANALRQRFRIGRSRILILGDLDPEPIHRRTIRDPWGCDEQVFEESYARIERCIRALVTLLTVEK
jgi:protein-tyrosine phosphatase